MMIAYTCIFFRSPSRSSFQFYATRLMGALHSMKELFKPQRRVMEKSERAIPLIPNTGGVIVSFQVLNDKALAA